MVPAIQGLAANAVEVSAVENRRPFWCLIFGGFSLATRRLEILVLLKPGEQRYRGRLGSHPDSGAFVSSKY